MNDVVKQSEHHIFHIQVESQSTVYDVLRDGLNLKDQEIQALLELGSIYKNSDRLQLDFVTPESVVLPNDYLRVHTKPRRFNVSLLKYPESLVYENEDFIIINKPSGLPVPPTVDNFQENLTQQLMRIRGEPVYVTHRLDIATSGLILFAKNRKALVQFNQLLQNRQIEKKYLAVVEGSFAYTGRLKHFMQPSPKAPKVVAKDNPSGQWHECTLEILSTQYDHEQNRTHLDILLITGRTHQIRAQLAYEGFPIIGDRLYGSPIQLSNEHEYIMLQAKFLAFNWNEKKFQFSL